MMHGGMMKSINNNDDSHIERLENISYKEIKNKFPDKIVGAYSEGERLVLVLDKCRLKFDNRVPQRHDDVYGAIHRK